MALTTTMRTVRRHLSWLDYYIKASEEPQGPSSICREGNSVFNKLVESYLQDDAKFNDKIDQNPNFNFLLLPSSTRGTLNVFHCNFLFEDTTEEETLLIGVNGTRFNSPWKVISSKHLTSPLRKPTRKKSSLSIPSLTSLTGCSSAEEFAGLVGEEDGAELKLIVGPMLAMTNRCRAVHCFHQRK